MSTYILRWNLLFCIVIAGLSDLKGEDWPQFLGPQRDGTSAEDHLLDKFPANGPEVLWRVPGGVSMSAITVAESAAYTVSNLDTKQVAVALDAKTGETRWQTVVGKAYENGMGNGPRATPAISGETVYIYTGDGIVCALAASDGKLRWKQDMMQLCQSEPSEYGMSSSPLLVDDHLIVHVGGEKSAVVCLDANNGELQWMAGSGPAGYSSPTVLQLEGTKQVVSVTGNEAMGISLENGSILWRYPFQTDYACNTANPVVVGESVFVSAGENHGCVLLDIKQVEDRYQVEPRWESTFSKSVMRNEWQTSIVVDGYLYGFDNVGAAGPITHLSCIELATGKPQWQKPRFGKGNMVYADGKFWITTMEGELILAEMSPSGYEEKSRAQLFDSTRQTMSIANGMGFIRDTSEIICLRLRDAE